MANCKKLLLLGLGLCMVFHHANTAGGSGGGQKQTASSSQSQEEDNLANKLENFKRIKTELQDKLSKASNVVDKQKVEKDLSYIEMAIQHIMETPQVTYRDYLRMKENQKEQYEKEIDEIKKTLEKQTSMQKKNLDVLTAEKQKIEEELANIKQASKLNEERLEKANDTLQKDKEDAIKKLETSKNKHAKAINAITANSYEGYKPVRIPQQTEINKLKDDLKEFVTMKDKKKQKEGLLLTKTKLTSLLPILYEHSKFFPETDRKDMEDALSVMEMNTVLVRDEQNRQSKERVQKIEGKDLTELSDDEIESLWKINAELAVSNRVQQDVGTRSAYLKGLLEVDDLINECSDAIKASEQGKIAKFLANAIAEAKQGNLAKLWTGAA